MSATIRTAVHIHGAPYANACAVIMALTLLTGYATVAAAQANPHAAPSSDICNSDTDTFCIEGAKDKGARLNRQALEYAARQNHDEAMSLFKRAIESDNSNPEYHYNLGVSYNFQGMPEESESSYMDVLAIEPNDPNLNRALANTYFNLACLYALQGKKDQAFKQLEKLFTVDPVTLYRLVQSDKDLDSLRDDPRYKQLIAKKPDSSGETGVAKTPDETNKSSKPANPKKTAKPKKPAKPRLPAK